MQTYKTILETCLRQGVLTPFAWRFACTVERLASAGSACPDELFLAAALAAHQWLVSQHVCIRLDRVRLLADCLTAEDDQLKALLGQSSVPADWCGLLASSTCAFAVTDGTGADAYKPLVLEKGRLYLRRYWVYENRLADLLRARAAASADPVVPTSAEVAALVRGGFVLDDGQIEAVRTALAHPTCVITGGPGTGKTTIVGVVLAALLARNVHLRISLCAPTGKAQARLKEALREEIREHLALESGDAVETALKALEPATIHRLLRYNPLRGGFSHDADNLLDAQVLVVDESSMVALPLMVKLLTAVRSDCRVILLGDQDQLAAVETGAVLADICAAWKNNPQLARLIRSHRFDPAKGIGRLKDAVNAGDCAAVAAIRAAGDGESLAFDASPATTGELETRLRALLKEETEFAGYAKAETPQEVFRRFDQFRVLCAVRRGPCGVEAVNLVMQRLLGIRRYGRGYPVMVTENDNGRRLFNGDIGICWPEEPGSKKMVVLFQDGESADGFRRVGIAQLPPHEPVFAMTIHKAQGSGFGHVLMLLPGFDLPLLTRELVYTGITRARTHCRIWADEPILAQAVARVTERMSGLAGKMAGV